MQLLVFVCNIDNLLCKKIPFDKCVITHYHEIVR